MRDAGFGGNAERRPTAASRHARRRRQREEPAAEKPSATRRYETVGYVIRGTAKLHLEGQIIRLEAGDAWLVPGHAEHTYEIVATFEAIEATSPPARIHERDEA